MRKSSLTLDLRHRPTRALADLRWPIWSGSPRGSDDPDDLLAKITGLGLHRVRIDFTWSNIQPGPTTWNWRRYDAFVAKAGHAHVDILGILDYGAAWANKAVSPPNGDEDPAPPRPRLLPATPFSHPEPCYQGWCQDRHAKSQQSCRVLLRGLA